VVKINDKSSVAEPCHFHTVSIPVQVPTSYFPSYGSGSGSDRGKMIRLCWNMKYENGEDIKGENV
jgi:hypothetical protein